MKTKVTPKPAAGADAPALSNLLPAIEQRLGPVEYWPIDRVCPYEDNPRKHPERQIVQLMASIQEFGFAMPVLASAEGELICGHARLQAAQRLGLTEVPVLIARYWSKAQIKAYRLTDNRLTELGSWDERLLRIEIAAVIELGEVPIEVMGWSTGEIDVLLDGVDAEDPEDELPAVPETPVARLGDLWELGKHRLLCGSSLEPEIWDRLMASEIGAMSINDGPFNVKINGHVSSTKRFDEFAMASGEMTQEEFTEFNANWLGKVSRHVRDGAIIMAFMDHAHLLELITAARKANLKQLNLCVWAKTNGSQGTPWRSQCEFVLVLKHGSAPHYDAVQMGRHGRHRTTLWTHAGANAFGATRDADLAAHPTVKPIALLAEAIRDVTRQGEIVIDAFAGSGSTILACERTKRVCRTIEIEPRYVDVAIARWEKMTGGQAVLADTGQTFTDVAASRGEAS